MQEKWDKEEIADKAGHPREWKEANSGQSSYAKETCEANRPYIRKCKWRWNYQSHYKCVNYSTLN